MISLVQPLPVGNALRLFVTPPAGAECWRILRRPTDAFTGPGDTGAVVVVDGCTDAAVLDTTGIENGAAYCYRDYAWDGSAWTDSGVTVTGTPQATYGDPSPNTQQIVMDRLRLGLAVEVAAGRLTAHPETGVIQVLSAPFAAVGGATFPVVSVHVDDHGPAHRALGEALFPLSREPDGTWTDNAGWLSGVTLNIVGVSLNPDQRMSLREAIRRVIQANLSVFQDAGMSEPSLRQTDTEALGPDNAALYVTAGVFTCSAPSFVTDNAPPIADVVVQATVYGDTVDA